jgi:hypothetical protein
MAGRVLEIEEIAEDGEGEGEMEGLCTGKV